MGYVQRAWAWCRAHALAAGASALVVVLVATVGTWWVVRPQDSGPHHHGIAAGSVHPSPAGVVYYGTDAFGPNRIATQASQVRAMCDREVAHGGDIAVVNNYGDTVVLYEGQDKLTYLRKVTAEQVTAGATALAGDVIAVDVVGSNPGQPIVQWMQDGTVHVVAGTELSPAWAANFGSRYLTVPFLWVAFTTRCDGGEDAHDG